MARVYKEFIIKSEIQDYSTAQVNNLDYVKIN